MNADEIEAAWSAVDRYVDSRLVPEDEALRLAVADANAAGLPPIQVSPSQGKLLHLLARLAGAHRILEVGTLAGYSTIWLARALPPGGRLVTLEIDAQHVEVARRNLARAGVGDHVEVVLGDARASLRRLVDDRAEPFDLVFIDADKPSNVAYLEAALRLVRPGALIVVDNVVREGGILDAESADPSVVGTRALFEAVAREPRLSATAVQTVGVKGWDGFLLARVER